MTNKILKQTGYKLTKPRKSILKLLQKNHIPLTATEIHKKIKNINLVSIYRTLKLFSELKIVQQENINGENFYYFSQKKHHHIICDKCGYMECIPCHHSFHPLKNFTNIKHQLILNGICKKCT